MNRCTLLMSLYVVCVPALCVHAAQGDNHCFNLEWHEDGFSDIVKADISQDRPPFRVEPEITGQPVWRGTLEIGPRLKQEPLAFIWIPSKGLLYVDLNRDGDLKNDGILEQVTRPYSSEFHQEFPSFPLSLISDKGEYRYRLEFILINAGNYHSAYIRVISGYSSVIQLQGKEYNIGIVDCLKGAIESDNTLTVSSALVTDPNLLCRTHVPQNIFLGGRLYSLHFEFKKHESKFPVLQCVLTEQDAQLGKLRIECPDIKQLILSDDKTLVMCDLDKQINEIPVGSYGCGSLVWGDLSPHYVHKINITSDSEYKLIAGGPLRNSVDVWRKGNLLRMNYLLLGAGDERYSIFEVEGADYENRPFFAIYKGDIQVGSGKFEYG